MDLVREFRWTTRAGVCEQLLRIALQADPAAGEPEAEWMDKEIVPGRVVDLLRTNSR